MPPNSQGYLILAAGVIAEGIDLPPDPDDPRWPHLLIEAARVAGFDRPAALHEHADPDLLLDPRRLADRRRLIDPEQAGPLRPPVAEGGTIYLCAVDGDGMGVSLIQSNASGFGSLLFEPSTGINLHNRGLGFCVDPEHPAAYGPGRRPPHTLAPALVTAADGSLRATVGSMGGDAQPQIVLQLLARLLAAGQPPATAVHSARFVLANHGGGRGFDTWDGPGRLGVDLEADAPAAWFTGLSDRGHELRRVGARQPWHGPCPRHLGSPRRARRRRRSARRQRGRHRSMSRSPEPCPACRGWSPTVSSAAGRWRILSGHTSRSRPSWAPWDSVSTGI